MPQLTRHLQISIIANESMNQLVTLRKSDKTNNLIEVPLEKEGNKMSVLGLTWRDFQGLSWIFEPEFE